jgi:hypothetical protein
MEPRTVAGNFEVTVVLTDKRQLRLTGYRYSDDTQEDFQHRVNDYMDIADLQSVRADIANKEAEFASALASIEALFQHHETLIEKQKTGKLTSQEKQQFSQYEQSARLWVNKKDSLEAAIKAGKKRLNGSAA